MLFPFLLHDLIPNRLLTHFGNHPNTIRKHSNLSRKIRQLFPQWRVVFANSLMHSGKYSNIHSAIRKICALYLQLIFRNCVGFPPGPIWASPGAPLVRFSLEHASSMVSQAPSHDTPRGGRKGDLKTSAVGTNLM